MAISKAQKWISGITAWMVGWRVYNWVANGYVLGPIWVVLAIGVALFLFAGMAARVKKTEQREEADRQQRANLTNEPTDPPEKIDHDH